MPCESCNAQFNVFKRKRLCSECRRFYCNHCLQKRNDKILCERCVIFTTRPVSKVDLLKLKPKDLIFYLQSKHISTTGCVEKEELVNLILIHVNSGENVHRPENNTAPSNQSGPTDDGENCSNPFDQIKQTCQNLFNSFTEKISNDLNLDGKTSPTSSNPQQNIFNQPRPTTREIPTYASSLNKNGSNIDNQSSNSVPNTDSSTLNINYDNTPGINSSNSSSSPSSPVISVTSISSQSLSSQHHAPEINNLLQRDSTDQRSFTPNVTITNDDLPSIHSSGSNRRIFENVIQDSASGSGCECSDDEVIKTFQSRYRTPPQTQPQSTSEKLSPISQTDSAFEDQIPGPSGSAAESGSASKSSSGNQNCEESSGSSFEELGAVGGTSSDNENWQFVNKVELAPFGNYDKPIETNNAHSSNNTSANSTSSDNRTFQSHSNVSNICDNRIQELPQRPRRLIRRRSDGILYHHRNGIYDGLILPTQLDEEESDDGNIEETIRKRSKKSCNKCGKNKKNLKKYVAKFKQQLESTQMSEAEVKQEIDQFLIYLENRSKECSDSETGDRLTDSNRGNDIRFNNGKKDTMKYFKHDNRFINLGDFTSSSDLEDLTVKQLKEILMLNRVDYKGCCEKQELLDRVYRLWKDLQTSPAVEKLGTDDLCKICMDAPIECVILECGHMATCTNCGKVLSECPICRQYIVRVVRFFRA